MNTLPDWLATCFASLEQSGLGELVRMTPRLYPILMGIHVLGIALLVGSALAVDLRLLGGGRALLPVKALCRYLLPFAHLGFGIVAVTGLAMFAGVASTVGASAAAPWKLGLILIAGINILVFHFGVYRRVMSWDIDRMPPWPARVAGAVSAACWISVIFAGRFLAY